MKKFLSMLAVLTVCICALVISASAATVVDSGNCGASGDNVTWKLDSDGVLTISGEGAMADYSRANAPWYSARKNITEVIIQNGVTTIGGGFFYYCTSLTSVSIPNSVTAIDDYAFRDCTGLTTVTIPDSVTTIGEGAFEGCTSLKSVSIPNSVTNIGSYSFSYCTSLTSVTIPNSVTTIGNYAFRYCTSLTSVTIPNSVTSIGRYAFCGCAGLTSVTIPNSVTSIGESAFRDCTGLTTVTIPNSVTSIGTQAFSGCTSLSSVTLPDSVQSIGDSAFSGCTSLTEISIPDSVRFIYASAFSGCTSLTSVTMGDVDEIRTSAFDGCTSLSSIIFNGRMKVIGESAFRNCSALTQLELPDGLESIGAHAFRYCTGLTTVEIPDSVTSIGNYAFDGCTKLSKVQFKGTQEQWETLIGENTTVFPKGVTVRFGNPVDTPDVTIKLNDNLKPVLRWDAVEGANRYYIYRSTSKNSGYKYLTYTTATSFTNTSVEEGVTYYYQVRAVSVKNGVVIENTWSGYSAPVGIAVPTAGAVVPLDTPVVSITTNKTSGKPVLSWAKVSGADRYYIYRSTSKSSGYKYFTYTTGTSFTNTSTEPGVTYYYQLRAVRVTDSGALINDSWSKYSTPVGVTCACAKPVVEGENDIATGAPTISWEPVAGAGRYYIYRSTSEWSGYSYWTYTTKTSFTNTSVEAGVTYYYQVCAYPMNGNTRIDAGRSAYSTPVGITAKTVEPLEAPEVTLAVDKNSGKPVLTWDAVEGADRYYIERSASPNSGFQHLTWTAKTSYTNRNADVGETWYYRVRAVTTDNADNVAADTYSDYSDVVEGTCVCERPVVDITLNRVGSPTLSWDEIPGAGRYYIYLSTSQWSGYSYWTWTSDTSIVNAKGNLTSGTTYYYQVQAVALDGSTVDTSTYGGYSTPVGIKVK